MPKRQLTEEEKTITRRNVDKQKELISYYGFIIDYYELELNKGIGVALEEKRKEYADKLNQYKNKTDAKSQYEFAKAELMLKTGLTQNSMKQIREYTETIKAARADLQMAQFAIRAGEDQLENGVEVAYNKIKRRRK